MKGNWKKRMKVEKYIDQNIPSLEGKVILVTGANSGIGFEASRIFASKKATLIFACRNEKKAEAAKEKILKEFPNTTIHILLYDQSSLSSIRHFVNEVTERFPKIDVTVCNAGIYHPKEHSYTQDQFPLTIGTNYIGTYYLLMLLMPHLEKNQEGRVIIVSSLTYHFHMNAPFKVLTEDEKKQRDAVKYIRSDKYKEEFNKLDSDERRSLRQQASDSDRRLNDLMAEKGIKDLDDQRAMVRALQDSPEFREDMSEQELKSLIEEKNEARKVGNDYLGGKDFDQLDYAERQRVVDVASYHMDQAAYEKEEKELQQLQEQKESIQNNQALSDQQKKAELAKVQQGKDDVHARRTDRATPVINESSNFNQHREDVKKGRSYTSHKNTLNKKR